MLHEFTVTANTIASTTRKGEKERVLAEYLARLDDASLERAATFFAGAPFARKDERVAGVGWATIADAVADASGHSVEELWEIYPKHADLGDSAAELFPSDPARTISIPELGETFDLLAATAGASEKKAILTTLFRRLDAQGVRFAIKILQSEMRIGLQEGLVESAIAKAFGRPIASVRQANMLTGDIGATALLARSDALEGAKLSLFRPFAFMLAQPEESADDILAALGAGAFADDKYDGIRAQIHSDGAEVRIFSRTLDDITHRFPEVAGQALALARPMILDGELVAFRDRILPFADLQKRLGRRAVTPKLLESTPVVYFAFDILYLDGETLFESPLQLRLERLRSAVGGALIRISEQTPLRDAAHLEELFAAARARANEGLVVKDPSSAYTPGRRGKAWLKYKKALATLDCVVTYAQYGNGKRRAVLSDLTFAVLREGELVTIGKAYSGLTDREIAGLTEHFQKTTIERHGPVHRVQPEIVLEIAFDRIQESARHRSGYALRFPRIVRIRDDKSPDEISTIDEVRRIYEGQLLREAPETKPE